MASSESLCVSGTRLVKELTDARPETAWRYEYSPESFSTTELDFSRDICDAVCEGGQDQVADIRMTDPARHRQRSD